jgi:alanine or glycine:cation symporter, AGCS family
VVICLMSALVIVTTGVWKADASTKAEMALYAEPNVSTEVVYTAPADSLIKVVALKEDDARNEVVAASLKAAAEDKKSWVQVKLTEFDKVGFLQTSELADRTGWGGGIWLTSRSFGSVISWFPYVLTVAVVLFAFSTMICWYYYGEQALGFLVNNNPVALTLFKVFFCLCVIVGSAASLSNVLLLSDAMYFAMVLPNLIGLYFLLPVVKEELDRFLTFVKRVDGGESPEEADRP